MTHRPAAFRGLFVLSALAGMALLSAAARAQANTAPDAPPLPVALVDGFEGVFGVHPGQRRGGAKGLCAEGHFTGMAEGRALTTASAFSGERIPVVARFSLSGGNPKAPDKARTPRNLALQMALPGGESWRLGNISAPVHSAATPQDMLAGFQARRPDPQTGKPDPAKVKAFADAHPEARVQADWLAGHGVPASFTAVNYWGVHAFKFVDSKGQSRYARWVFEPVGGQELLDDAALKALPDEFLADDLRKRVAVKPVEFDMRLQLAEPGDPLVNPTQAWPEGRRSVTVGRLSIDKVEAGPGGQCEPVVFDPMVLPKGIEASDDPVLRMRSAAYAVSASRRLAGK